MVTPSGENFGEKSAARMHFDRWANGLREVQAIRQKATGRGGSGGVEKWWEGVPDDFKCFLLSTIAVDDWERYEGAKWAALPDGLRCAIAMQCRALARVVTCCPWR